MKWMILVSSAALMLSGCGLARLESRAISYKETTGQSLYIWRAHYSAGMGTADGICAQGALAVTTTAIDANARLGAAALGAINPALTAAENEELLNVGLGTSQSAMLTNATNGQTAFANHALFYLCQISLNRQDLQPEQLASMWSAVMAVVPRIGTTGVSTNTISSNRPAQGPAPAPQPTVPTVPGTTPTDPAAPTVPGNPAPATPQTPAPNSVTETPGGNDG